MSETRENKMGQKPILPLLISMSLPAIFSMLVQALYNVVDSAFVGQLGQDAFTAVSLAFPVQTLMIAVSVGTGIGINSLIARRLGERNREEASQVALHGVLCETVSSLLFLVFGLFFSRPFLAAFTDNPSIIEMGTSYVSIVTTLSMGLFWSITAEKVLQGTGNMRDPMLIQLIGAIINIILDPIFIFGWLGLPAMGVAGAAIATVVGQFCSFFYGLFVMVRGKHEISISPKIFSFRWRIVGNIYQVGFPSIIMQSISAVLNVFLNNILISFSDAAVAVLGVYFKLQSFIFMPMFGLNNGALPIMGFNYGARSPKRLMECLKWALLIGLGISGVGVLLFWVTPTLLLGLFNASPEMVELGVPAMHIISLCFVFASVGICLSNFFQAIGEGFRSLLISTVRQVVVILPAAYFLSRFFGVTGVWMSFPIAEVVAFLLVLIIFRSTYRKKILTMETK
ncbi:MAG: MATE family efflux transporter [Oscillospiraceae bacterium]|nr:MATE family efflux transporter [Oscillospiraceae bacterium]